MTEILKIVSIAVIGAMIFVYLKSLNSELSALSAVATGVVLIFTVIDYVLSTVKIFSELSYNLGVSTKIFMIVIKIIIISYLIEFCENLCSDLGVTNIGAKVSLCGKIIIFVTAVPVYKALIDAVTTFIK